MYARAYTRPDIAYAASVLGRFQSNSRMNHWKITKKDMTYLQHTKEFMFVYNKK